MSKSEIQCPSCRRPVAHRKHTGTIHVTEGVKVVYRLDGSLELRCSCGKVRVIRMSEPKAA